MSFFIAIFFLALTTHAEFHYEIEGALRTDPRAMNMTAVVAYDHLLRGEFSKENPFYSYARAGLIAGGSPSAGVFLEYAPIAPLIFSVQKNVTHRFQNASRFDCETYQCKKNIDRTDYAVRGVVGLHKFFFSQSYLWRELRTESDSLPFYLEQEHGVVPEGYHRFAKATSILGYQISDEQIAGILYLATWLSEGHFYSHTASAFFRQQCGGFSLTFGVSQYNHEQFDIRGPAGFITLNFDQGKKLSLF